MLTSKQKLKQKQKKTRIPETHKMSGLKHTHIYTPRRGNENTLRQTATEDTTYRKEGKEDEKSRICDVSVSVTAAAAVAIKSYIFFLCCILQFSDRNHHFADENHKKQQELLKLWRHKTGGTVFAAFFSSILFRLHSIFFEDFLGSEETIARFDEIKTHKKTT